MKQLMLTQEKVAAEGIAVVIFFLCVYDQYDHKKERPQELPFRSYNRSIAELRHTVVFCIDFHEY
jgi:hypothetical protein